MWGLALALFRGLFRTPIVYEFVCGGMIFPKCVFLRSVKQAGFKVADQISCFSVLFALCHPAKQEQGCSFNTRAVIYSLGAVRSIISLTRGGFGRRVRR